MTSSRHLPGIVIALLCVQTATLSQVPQRIWGTYFGGIGGDDIMGIAIDGAQNVYVCGVTNNAAANWLVTPGAHQAAYGGGGADCFLAKFDSNGQRIWGTFIGGADTEAPWCLETDHQGNVVMVGYTFSDTGIATAGSHQTARLGMQEGFIVKFDSSGHRIWGTYYGGSQPDNVYGVAVDGSDNIVVTGWTSSSNGIATPGSHQSTLMGAYNAFLAKFSSAGTLLWGTYYGGNGSSVSGDHCAVDNNDNIIIWGCTLTAGSGLATAGCHQPSFGGVRDLFIGKFDPFGIRQWGTYFGGTGEDAIMSSVGIDRQNNLYFAGETNSTSGIATPGAYQTTLGGGIDAYLVKFGTDGVRHWGTYFGGSGDDHIRYVMKITQPDIDAIYLAGSTGSMTGIATANAYQTTITGSLDAYISKFDTAGHRIWGTYYGGSQNDDIKCQAFSPDGAIYVGGMTTSTDVVGVGGFQSVFGGLSDGLIAKFRDVPCTLSVSITPNGSMNLCPGDSIVLDAGSGYASYQWTPGGDTTRTLTVRQAGTYIVRVMDGSYCIARDTVVVGMFPPVLAYAGIDTSICQGSSTVIGLPATGGLPPYSYAWSPPTSLNTDTIPAPTASPSVTTSYIVTVTDANGCVGRDTVIVTVTPKVSANILITGDTVVCAGRLIQLSTDSSAGRTFQWLRNGVVIPGANRSSYTPTNTGRYRVVASVTPCIDTSREVFVTVFPPPVVNIAARSDTLICAGKTATLSTNHGTGYSYQWTRNGTSIPGAIGDTYLATESGLYRVRVIDVNGCEDSSRSVLVTVSPPVIAEAGPDRTICAGDAVWIGAPASGGTPPFRFSWSPATGLDATTVATPSAHPSTTTRYTVHVKDENGCESMDSVLVRVYPKPVPDILGALSLCPGGSAVYRAKPGSGQSYRWSVTGGVLTSGANADSITVRWGTAGMGSVSLLVTLDSSGCSATRTVSVAISEALRPGITPASAVLCEGSSVQFDAGNGYTAYRWTFMDTIRIVGTAQLLTVSNPGRYIVTVWDGSGCSGKDTVDVSMHAPPSPKVEVTGALAFCRGDSVKLTVRDPYVSYRWSTGDTTRAIWMKDSASVTVSVIDSNGCSGISQPVSIIVHARPSATIEGLERVCNNSEVVYRVRLSPNMSATWSLGGGTILTSRDADSLAVRWGATGPGLVRVVVTDARTGCSASFEMSVVISDGLRPVIQGGSSFCEGDSLILSLPGGPFDSYEWSTGAVTDRIRITAPGPYFVRVRKGSCSGTSDTVNIAMHPRPIVRLDKTGPVVLCKGGTTILTVLDKYTAYRWSTGENTQDLTVSRAGSYAVTVTDSNGCTGQSQPVLVVIDSLPSPAIQGMQTACIGSQPTTYTADSGASAYGWSIDNGVIVSGQSTRSISVQWTALGTGRLTLFVTNANGCSDSVVAWPVSVRDTLQPAIDVDGILVNTDTTIIRCAGSRVALKTDTGYAGYRWSDGASTDSTFAVAGAGGTYRVEVTNQGGCRGTSPAVTIRAAPLPTPEIDSTGPLTFCQGASVELFTRQSYAAYRWSTGESTPRITVSSPGIYSVEVTDSIGCVGRSADAIVTIHAATKPSISGPSSVCVSDQRYSAGPAGPGVTFSWQVYGGIALTDTMQQAVTIRWAAAGSGMVIVRRSENLCAGSDTMRVTIGSTLAVADIGIDPPGKTMLCPGDSVRLCAEPGYSTYLWSPSGATTRCIMVSTAGTFSVTVHDTSNCEGTSPAVSIGLYSVTQPSISQAGVLLTSTPATSYQWYLDDMPLAGDTARQLTVTRSGTYRVCTRDEHGCGSCSDPLPVRLGSTVSTTIALECAAPGAVPPGARVRLPVRLLSSTNLATIADRRFEAFLSYGKNLLAPAFDHDVMADSGSDARIRVRGESVAGMDQGLLLDLPFIAMLGDSACARVRIDSIAWLDGTIVVNLANATCEICVETCREGGTRLFSAGGTAQLRQNRPNPFNAVTVIEYEVIEEGVTDIGVYDGFGRRVATLVHATLRPGRYIATFDAGSLSTGVYLCVLRTPTAVLTRRMEFVK